MDGPRKDDHLVEPLFAGLEQADAQESKKPVRSPFWRTYRLLGISVAILVWIVLMLVFRD
tara:strand:+ start:515 stop:694 length:180 start_codon:yes stop_codon:yes gene_type:complete